MAAFVGPRRTDLFRFGSGPVRPGRTFIAPSSSPSTLHTFFLHLQNCKMTASKKLTIIELEGTLLAGAQRPSSANELSAGMHLDDTVEKAIFAAAPFHDYDIEFLRVNLGGINGTGEMKPVSLLSRELCERVDGIMVLRHYMTKEDVKRFPNLKVVVRCGVGYDRLDRAALAEVGVLVCNVPGASPVLGVS